MEVLIIDIGIKHEATVKIDKVLIERIEAAYSIIRVKATNIPFSATDFAFIKFFTSLNNYRLCTGNFQGKALIN